MFLLLLQTFRSSRSSRAIEITLRELNERTVFCHPKEWSSILLSHKLTILSVIYFVYV